MWLIVVWIYGDGGGERDLKDKVCGVFFVEVFFVCVCVCVCIGGNV